MACRESILNVLASSATGGFVIAITNPLDCLKQRWQNAPAISCAFKGGICRFAQSICVQEGVIRGLWLPGVGTNIAACSCSVGARLGFYPWLRDAFSGGSGGDKNSVGMFIAGLSGGAVGYIVGAPFFYASRVAQTSSLDFGFQTLKQLHIDGGGLVGLWRGSPVLVARGAVMSATQLTTYDMVKTTLVRCKLMADGPLLHGCCSFLASIALTTAICPLDCLLTRYQAAPLKLYSGPWDCAVQLVRKEGVRVFVRGWWPLWIRFLPSSVLTFYIYEQIRWVLIGSYMD